MRAAPLIVMARSLTWGWIAACALLAGLMACSPELGDRCAVSTDCSVRGDRLCDLSQPGGYCTQLNCRAGSCADEGSCVLFGSAIPGCGFDDRAGPFGSRVGRSFCMAQCESDSDCRGEYVCADPRTAPWNAVILDDNQIKRSCLPRPFAVDAGDAGDAGAIPDPFVLDSGVAPDAAIVVTDASANAPLVCGPAPPAAPIDASPPSIQEAGAKPPPLFPRDAGDGGSDAGASASTP